MRRIYDALVVIALVRAARSPSLDLEIEPLERLKLARDREKIERDERRTLEQRATTMLAVTVALAGLGLAGLRQLSKSADANGDGADFVLAWAGGPLLYLLVTIVLLVRALTVPAPGPVNQPAGEAVAERLVRAETRSTAIAGQNLEVLRRVRQATWMFAGGFVLLVLYAAVIAIAQAG